MFFDQQQHNSMNTPTPRTDAEWSASFDEYSQQLETELTALTAERDQLRAEFEKIAVIAAQTQDRNVSLRIERDQLRAELATERAHRKELSTLVKRFVRESRRARPSDPLSYLAVDYLVRNKLHGEPMRPAVTEDAK